MKSPLFACHISHEIYSVELHGKVYVLGAPLEPEGRVGLVVDREELLAMRETIQAALDGWAPTPANAAFNGKTPTGVVVDDINPEDLA